MNSTEKKDEPIRLFVSPDGNDRWSGQLAAANKSRSNGPFATIERARKAVRALRRKDGLPQAVRVELRGGVYELPKPLVFDAMDSGSPAPTDEWGRVTGPGRDVTYGATRGEKPILSGGRRITGWRATTVNGRTAWIAKVPGVAAGRPACNAGSTAGRPACNAGSTAGRWNFTQLWVNGRRAQRPRLPRQGLFRIESLLGTVVWKGGVHKVLFTGQDWFRFAPGDLRDWRNVRDIEFVALHFWIESRAPFAGIDTATREARLQWKSRMRLTDDHTDKGAQYYVENVFEALEKPGEWYLDRPSGQLTYLPRRGENIKTAEIVAPYLPQLVILQGDAVRGKPVEHVNFEGLTFSHSEWVPGKEALTAAPQAACHIPGALSFRHARKCAVRHCAIEHVGSYGIELTDGCTDVQVTGNRIADLAGGGVKIWHTLPPKTGDRAEIDGAVAPRLSCRRISVSDNEIADGGHRWRQAVGVLIGKCSGNQIVHNHIHDFDYTGISVGWTWGYAEGNAYGNIIEHNHIHHVGRGVLSDMGAIYMLGVSPGTRLRYNLIHDVESRGYGGWGIYTDEGSSFILIENNVVYRTKSAGFHQHYGRENLVHNNIFAFGREEQFTRSRLETHLSFTLTGNIFYFDTGGKVATGDWTDLRAVVDRNLYFNRCSILELSKPLEFAGGTFRQWQRRGMDRHSLVADPLFVAPQRGDFRLKPGSPAAKIGFVPIDVSDVGPRIRLPQK